MAHFANINEENIVTEVIVVSDDQENNANEFLASIGLPGNWLQCSYNNSIRGRFPAAGWIYSEQDDKFYPPRPKETSWVWDEAVYQYVPPKPIPSEYPVDKPEDQWIWVWSEESIDWVLEERSEI